MEDEEEEDDDYDEFDGTSLVFPLGSGPCGCAGGSPPGTASRGGGVMFAHSVSELHP